MGDAAASKTFDHISSMRDRVIPEASQGVLVLLVNGFRCSNEVV
jgi:hypothetical protein